MFIRLALLTSLFSISYKFPNGCEARTYACKSLNISRLCPMLLLGYVETQSIGKELQHGFEGNGYGESTGAAACDQSTHGP